MAINRVRKGVPAAGQFATSVHAEAGVSIGADQGFPDAGEASVEELRRIADTGDAIARAEVTSSPRVPDDVLEQLADPDQPDAVRLAAASTGYPGTADRAARDRNPIVRAAALANGWDLPETTRRRLHEDRGVQRFVAAIAS